MLQNSLAYAKRIMTVVTKKHDLSHVLFGVKKNQGVLVFFGRSSGLSAISPMKFH